MKVTPGMLRKKGACESQVLISETEWPNGVTLTLAVLRRAVVLKLDLDWFAENFLKASALKAYEEAIAPAQKAYEEAKAPARKAYEEAMVPAQKAYREAMALARKAYREAMAPAQKAYGEAEASALWSVLQTKHEVTEMD